MKVVMYACCHENNAAFAYLMFLGSDAHASTATNHVIQFVFFMRALGIFPLRGQSVNSRAQSRNAQEFEIWFSAFSAAFLQFRDVKEIRRHLSLASLPECSEKN